MEVPHFTIDQFRTMAPSRLCFLEEKGFGRTSEFEETSSTGSNLVYVGKCVGFIFNFDFRDQCVDSLVVKVKSGKIKRNWEGGYSRQIYAHLVNHGYRGNPAGPRHRELNSAKKNNLEYSLDGSIELLKVAGQSLLRDDEKSLD